MAGFVGSREIWKWEWFQLRRFDLWDDAGFTLIGYTVKKEKELRLEDAEGSFYTDIGFNLKTYIASVTNKFLFSSRMISIVFVVVRPISFGD